MLTCLVRYLAVFADSHAQPYQEMPTTQPSFSPYVHSFIHKILHM